MKKRALDRKLVDAVAWRIYVVCTETFPDWMSIQTRFADLDKGQKAQARSLARHVLANGYRLPVVPVTDRVEFARR